MENKIKVAVYGSLKFGFGNHKHHLGNARKVCECETLPQYNLFSLGSFPGVTKGGKTSIQLEMYEVNDDELRGLDALEGNGSFYTREVIATSEGDAWIYLLPQDRYSGREIIKSGNWEK